MEAPKYSTQCSTQSSQTLGAGNVEPRPVMCCSSCVCVCVCENSKPTANGKPTTNFSCFKYGWQDVASHHANSVLLVRPPALTRGFRLSWLAGPLRRKAAVKEVAFVLAGGQRSRAELGFSASGIGSNTANKLLNGHILGGQDASSSCVQE